ncbi:MAG: hypothetical protein EXS09_01930 [Gemmataceae bacterium]|nr:hypothetical protein [Gemmataceae bacterium]
MMPRLMLLQVLPFFLLLVTLGCDNKRAKTERGVANGGTSADAEAQAVLALETQQDQAQCRTVLQQLDNLPSVTTRPTLPVTELAEVRRFLQLSPSEATEVGQTNFSQTDAEYLEECLLVRTGVRSLRQDGGPALEQAKAAFDWVCRLVYVDDRIAWPAPTWMTLQTGSGVAHSRAYAILAAWQQLGLDACLIGPPGLKTAPSFNANTQRPDGKYSPIRACGVKIEKEIYLFDPGTGKALIAPDGKSVLTLTQARAKPELVRSSVADEAKTWQIFLAPPLSSLSSRMNWLQRLNPGNIGVKLFVDIGKTRESMMADLPGIPCEAWNPPGDSFSATRVLSLYSTESETDREKPSHRIQQRLRMIPLERMPRTNLTGSAFDDFFQIFAIPFVSLYFTPDSPRDLMLRSQFQQATSTLDRTKQIVENARTRFEQDKDIQKDFAAWSETFRTLNAAVIRPPEPGPAGVAAAKKTLEDFRNLPRNRDIERAFILGNAAKPLLASITFLMATSIHERAERTQRDSPTQAIAQWKNTEEWWGRFLDASSQASGVLPARDAHARELLKRCQQFTAK